MDSASEKELFRRLARIEEKLEQQRAVEKLQVSLPEAARLLDYSRTTLDRYIRNGWIMVSQLGDGHPKISMVELQRVAAAAVPKATRPPRGRKPKVAVRTPAEEAASIRALMKGR